jgi:glucokinase
MSGVKEAAAGVTAAARVTVAAVTPGRSVLAVDIGGTKLAAALVDPGGGLRSRVTRPTPPGDAEAVWAALAVAVAEAVGDDDIEGAGIGSAGPLDAVAGTVSPVNIPAWRGFPVRDRLAGVLGRPAVLVNDAVAAAVGEYHYGAGRGTRAMLGMVVSTGVGGGLILGGRVHAGATGNAGHIGHTIVDLDGEPCPCGARGCVETITSGPAMVRWALRNGWTCASPDAAALASGARDGHPVARAAFERSARALAAAIASASALCDLDRVVIGGGVARAWDVLEPPLSRALRAYAGLAFVRRAEVVPSELDTRAAFLGAAALIRDPELV